MESVTPLPEQSDEQSDKAQMTTATMASIRIPSSRSLSPAIALLPHLLVIGGLARSKCAVCRAEPGEANVLNSGFDAVRRVASLASQAMRLDAAPDRSGRSSKGFKSTTGLRNRIGGTNGGT